jgi:hypothetical protein
MKRQKSCGPRLGKLVHQLPGVVTFAYDLRFRRMIARWKDLSEKYNFWVRNIDLHDPCCSPFSQKTSFRASKWPRKLKTAKNSKLPKLPETCFGPVGEGGWPPISTWIKRDIRYLHQKERRMLPLRHSCRPRTRGILLFHLDVDP